MKFPLSNPGTLSFARSPGMSPNIPSPVNLNPTMFGIGSQMMGSQTAAAAMQNGGGGGAPNLSAMMTQQRLLELSGFNLRGYDLAQHMLSQQGNVSKLLGECKLTIYFYSLVNVIRARNRRN